MVVPIRHRCTYEEFHLRYLLIDLLHELYNEVYQLMLQHLFCVKIGDQERNVIALSFPTSVRSQNGSLIEQMYLHGLPPQYEECFRSLSQKPREFMHKYILDLIGLLDLDANPYAIYAGLYEHLLVLIARNGQRVQQHLWATSCFNLWHIVTF